MLRCIRFGEVLLDETFRTFLICNQCQTEFVEVPEFRVHLASSSCGQRLFKEDVVGLKFGAAQVTRTGKEKTYLLYNPADIQLATTEPVISAVTPMDGGDDAYLDLMKIEEELLDPRWYTDIAGAQSDVGSPQPAPTLPASSNTNKPMEYKELVKAVGPYVQFKENAIKRKSEGITVRRFQTKTNNPAASVKNPALPAKDKQSTDQPAGRLLNPAAKRKLDLAPKHVQFNDQVNVKYVINERLCTNVALSKRTLTQNSEKNEKNFATDEAVLKRRRTITIPIDQANIQPDFQERFVKQSSNVPKTAVIRNNAATTSSTTATTKIITKSNSVTTVVGGANSKGIANAKAVPTTSATQSGTQTHIKTLVPNPLVMHKQINGTKTPITTTGMAVKNPITYSKINSNGMKSEKVLPKPNASIVASQVVPSAARPKQRALSLTATGPVQPPIFATANQAAPPALAPLSSNKVANTTAIIAAKTPIDAHQQTNDILNKLQTRGLQVKRTQPCAIVANTAHTGQQNKTMELLQKLQSKGMKVKILNGKETMSAAAASGAQITASINLPTTTASTKMVSNVRNVESAIGKQNKTILNNKLIIKKVK
ncbi:uncharacterized protein LOC128866012 [Anastrepha ludens]|uniref:uncharacterized protein LOC128866012 n=1 Tax=Anastrepha ludens TaxID=28586 RepID=UPI0023B07A8B|nr:uncharacterized protein LOC128866012 [Anastrepha ludens]